MEHAPETPEDDERTNILLPGAVVEGEFTIIKAQTEDKES